MLKKWSAALVAIFVPLLLIAGGLVLLDRFDEGNLAAENEGFWIPVEEEALDSSQLISLALTWSEGREIVAPRWAGLVTDVAVHPGDELRSGDRVIQIDGVWRVAAVSGTPLYASVGYESSAAEKATAVEILRTLGYSNVDTWNWNAIEAVRDLADRLGVPGAANALELDPAWIVWLPTEPSVVGEVIATPGRPAPQEGEAVLALQSELTSVELEANPAGGQPPDFDDAVMWELHLNDTVVDSPVFPLVDPAQLAELTVSFGQERPETAKGTMSRSGASMGWVVPASSVLVDSNGLMCVIIANEEGDPSALAVQTIPGAGAGTAWIAAEAKGTLRVQSTPTMRDGTASCS